MKFNTQVCTTREQSERLLALGLKKETADMGWVKQIIGDRYVIAIAEDYSFIDVSAWSLHRLISLCEHGITINHRENVVTYNMCRDFYGLETIYDNLIDCIEYLINEGWFNKEYLEE